MQPLRWRERERAITAAKEQANARAPPRTLTARLAVRDVVVKEEVRLRVAALQEGLHIGRIGVPNQQCHRAVGQRAQPPEHRVVQHGVGNAQGIAIEGEEACRVAACIGSGLGHCQHARHQAVAGEPQAGYGAMLGRCGTSSPSSSSSSRSSSCSRNGAGWDQRLARHRIHVFGQRGDSCATACNVRCGEAGDGNDGGLLLHRAVASAEVGDGGQRQLQGGRIHGQDRLLSRPQRLRIEGYPIRGVEGATRQLQVPLRQQQLLGCLRVEGWRLCA